MDDKISSLVCKITEKQIYYNRLMRYDLRKFRKGEISSSSYRMKDSVNLKNLRKLKVLKERIEIDEIEMLIIFFNEEFK